MSQPEHLFVAQYELSPLTEVFQRIFVRLTDQARVREQVTKYLGSFIPKSIVNMVNTDTSMGAKMLAEWLQTEMHFDRTSAFPRHFDLITVFKSRRGRCEEYATLFHAFCRSLGIEDRLVWDMSDHIWNEIKYGDKWVMIDSTLDVVTPESRFARALSGKELSWILAFEPGRVTDVTFEYVPPEQVDAVKERRKKLQIIFETLIESFNLGATREDWES